MSDDAAVIAGRFNAFLRLLDEPYGGKVIHAHYAADAPLAFKYEVRSPRTLGPDEYALGLAAVALVREEAGETEPRRPRIREARLITLDAEGPDRRIAWFEAEEAVDGTPLKIAVGWTHEDASWKIGWLTLWQTVERWDWAAGRLQALAEYPFAAGAGLAVPRSWLDLAWHRLHGRPEPPLQVLPEARFACHGSGGCCTIGFAITVAPAAQAVIDAIPWAERGLPELEGTRLPALPDGQLLLKGEGERCRFLDEHTRCRVHQVAGRPVFTACSVFPFQFHHTPEGVAVSTSPTCASARGGLGPPLTERRDDLYQRLAMTVPAPPAEYRIEADGAADWPAFREAESGLLALLDRRDLPLARRLWLGCRLLDGQPLDDGPPPAAGPDDARPALLAQFAEAFALALPLAPEAARPLPAAAEQALEGPLTSMLRNQLFSKVHASDHGLRVAHHANVFMYVLARHAAARHPDGRVPDALLWRIGGRFMHGTLAAALAKHPRWLEMMRAPSFGGWLLAEPLPS